MCDIVITRLLRIAYKIFRSNDIVQLNNWFTLSHRHSHLNVYDHFKKKFTENVFSPNTIFVRLLYLLCTKNINEINQITEKFLLFARVCLIFPNVMQTLKTHKHINIFCFHLHHTIYTYIYMRYRIWIYMYEQFSVTISYMYGSSTTRLTKLTTL